MRLLEIILDEARAPELQEILAENKDAIFDQWTDNTGEKRMQIKLLVADEHSAKITGILEKFGHCRVIIYPVEGTLPKPKAPTTNPKKSKIQIGKFISISKEELYADIEQPVNLSANFLLMVVLSSFVAGIGILKDNVAIIIGAMVIAPFLGPNILLAFGTTLGDWESIRKAIITSVVSTGIALVISMIWGFFAGDLSEISLDPDISFPDIILALVCGFAGVITVLSGQGSTLVGVMVAAALLPPLMRAGLLFGGGLYALGLNALLVFLTNIICLNIAGIATFYWAGIKPGRWWEKERAKQKMRKAIGVWGIALLVLIGIILIIRTLR